MAEDSQSLVKFMSHLLTKVDVVKFDSMNNFDMWKCEIMDVLTTSNLKDSLHLKENPEETFEKRLGQDESDGVWYHQVLFDIKHQVSCIIWDFSNVDLGDPWKNVSYEEYRDSIASEEEV